MTPDEYAARQAVISALVAQYVTQFGKLFAKPALSLIDWIGFMQFLFPQIAYHREQAATLAREFYDFQRAHAHPELPRNNQYLESYSFDRFLQDMDPARERMSRADAPNDAIGQAGLQAVRAVENAGRQQIIHAVQEDPATHIIKGWARVATGRETCAWCLMLVSRGPVYLGADTAGLDLPDDVAARMISNGEDLSDYMEQWHAGCDCKVVPVYKYESWPGKAEADRALELWKKATLIAISEEDDPGVHTNGKNKGKQFTRNELSLNALRRMLDRGEVTSQEWAALSAA